MSLLGVGRLLIRKVMPVDVEAVQLDNDLSDAVVALWKGQTCK